MLYILVAGFRNPRQNLKAASLVEQNKMAAPHQLEVGAVVNPFAPDLDRELALLERKLAAGADFVQSQMIFDLGALRAFLERAAELLAGVRFYAGIALLRNKRIAERTRRLPSYLLPDHAYPADQHGRWCGAGDRTRDGARRHSRRRRAALYPLGAEPATREVAGAFRSCRGVPAQRC